MKANKQMRTTQALINTGLQPGVGSRRVTSAVLTASRARGKAVKTAGRSLGRQITGLKPGANERKYLEVTEATYVADYKLRLVFSDGKKRIVDFGPFLKKARNPDTTDYRDLKKFKSFHLDHGDLMWGDFQMIFPIMDLYRGTILKGAEAEPAHFVLSDAVSLPNSAANTKTTAASTVSYKKAKALARRTK